MAEVTSLRQKHETWTRGGPVLSDMDAGEISALEDRAVATIADPAPMGMWALATGSWMFGAVIAAFPTSALVALMPALMGFSGIALFIAGLYAYRRASVLSATAFCSFGALYFTSALYFGLAALGGMVLAGGPLVIYGFLLESFSLIALALAIASFRSNFAMAATMVGLWIGYALIGVPFLAAAVGVPGWSLVSAIGGWILCAAALFAYYTGAALVVNSAWSRNVLPLGGQP